ncbi:hypothetical protein BC936DRAFT_137962 [Jimgerdemannia flammicorona]|uniref:RRM domain-containing protein n=1 Tax=Jimgerdemannia flammicorona TaxID=994334 RepID=A0A433CWB9_9FUNG|nr:hypothetical protein BC936DRAFT_137962 [Jimgerdemannia flammicorona]
MGWIPGARDEIDFPMGGSDDARLGDDGLYFGGRRYSVASNHPRTIPSSPSVTLTPPLLDLIPQGYALVEYETYKEAKTAIEATNGTKFYDQTIHADFAFIRAPAQTERTREERGGRRFNDRRTGHGRRNRSASPAGGKRW